MGLSSATRLAPLTHATLCAILVLRALSLGLVSTQITDGDEQFEAVHQDIGRISGLAAQGSPQVAARSALVARQPAEAVANSQLVSPPSAAAAAAVAQVFERPALTARPSVGGSRKPNRITLVARRDPLPSAQSVAPTLVAAQLPAPLEAPAFTPAFAGPASAPLETEQPALSSFRQSATVHTPLSPPPPATQSAPLVPAAGSVSARHSALMAQVAAERAAAAGLLTSNNEPLVPLPVPLGAAREPAPLPLSGHQAQSSQAISSFARTLPNVQSGASPVALGTSVAAAGSLADESAHLDAAPSFEHVLGHGCPPRGLYSWENRDHCDRYYMCTNGTFTEEACPNGLAYSQMGAVYQHCAYNWNVDCGRKKTAEPISSPGCPWQFGIFPIVANGRCSIDYYACEWGVPETKRCTPEGLFYDDRIKGCQWADQLGCKSEKLLNFKCPPEDEDNPYWPYPRYYHDNKDVIVCVNEQPRLVHCNEDQLVDPGSLACIDIDEKKKKKF